MPIWGATCHPSNSSCNLDIGCKAQPKLRRHMKVEASIRFRMDHWNRFKTTQKLLPFTFFYRCQLKPSQNIFELQTSQGISEIHQFDVPEFYTANDLNSFSPKQMYRNSSLPCLVLIPKEHERKGVDQDQKPSGVVNVLRNPRVDHFSPWSPEKATSKSLLPSTSIILKSSSSNNMISMWENCILQSNIYNTTY